MDEKEIEECIELENLYRDKILMPKEVLDRLFEFWMWQEIWSKQKK